MKEKFPITFHLKSKTKWSGAFGMLVPLAMIGLCISLYEPGNTKNTLLVAGLSLFFLALFVGISWECFYQTSSLQFFEDHLIRMSRWGKPVRITYADITTLDKSDFESGGAYNLKTDYSSVKLSRNYVNYEEMFEILENHIKPGFEKRFLEKLENRHVFVCESHRKYKILPWFFMLVSIPMIYVLHFVIPQPKDTFETYTMYAITFIFALGPIAAISLLLGLETKYLFDINGFEIKKRFSSQMFLWEQITDIEYKYFAEQKDNVMMIILNTTDGKKIAIGAGLANFGAFCAVAGNRVRYDTQRGKTRDEGIRIKNQGKLYKRTYWFFVVMSIAFGYIIFVESFNCMDDYKLDRSCEIAEGRLTKKISSSDNNTFKYQFDVAGVAYRGSKHVFRDAFDQKKEGDTLAIEYLPSDPSINRPREITVSDCRTLLVFVFLGIINTAIFIYALVDQKKKMKKEREEFEGVKKDEEKNWKQRP